MADSTTFNRAVATEGVVRAKPRREKSRSGLAGRAVGWIALIAAGVAAVMPMSRFAEQEIETWALVNANDDGIIEALQADWSVSTSPDYLEALAEQGLGLEKPPIDTVHAIARRVVELDPSRASVWAQIAYLEAKQAGKINPASLDALTKSMAACTMCDEELIRWRFNFVLANWIAMPEAVRRQAFEQADLLRWIGPNAEFLAEMRVKAQQNGVPFDAYRAAVNTPVRTWDIGPGPRPKPAQVPTAARVVTASPT